MGVSAQQTSALPLYTVREGAHPRHPVPPDRPRVIVDPRVPPDDRMRALLDAQGAIAALGRQPADASSSMEVIIPRSEEGPDLEAVQMLCSPQVAALHLAGVASGEEMGTVADLLDLLEGALGIASASIAIHPWLDSAAGVRSIDGILGASQRAGRPVLDIRRLGSELGVSDLSLGLLAVRTNVVVAAHANGVGAPLEYYAEPERIDPELAAFGASAGCGGIVTRWQDAEGASGASSSS